MKWKRQQQLHHPTEYPIETSTHSTQHTAHKFVLMNNITSSAQINGMNISACICIGNGLIMIMTAAYDGCAHGSVIHTTNANMPNNAVHSFVQNEIQLSYTHIHTTHDATATV